MLHIAQHSCNTLLNGYGHKLIDIASNEPLNIQCNSNHTVNGVSGVQASTEGNLEVSFEK